MSKIIPAKYADNILNIRKEVEYERFIELVGSGDKLPEHWELLASALGVHEKTLANWRKLPEFEKARVRGINRRIAAMEKSGKNDWRQWEASLRLLGVKTSEQPTTNIQINIPILGGNTVQSNNSDPQIIEATETD